MKSRRPRIPELFRKTTLEEHLALIPYFKDFEIYTSLRDGEEKRALRRKDGEGGLETATKKDTLLEDREKKLTQIEIKEELSKWKVDFEMYEYNVTPEERLILKEGIQRFLDHRRDMLRNNTPYTEELAEKTSLLMIMMQAHFTSLLPNPDETEEEKKGKKEGRDFIESLRNEDPDLPNRRDKVRLKPEFRRGEWAESGDPDEPKYTYKEEIEKDEFWDGIVVILREPGCTWVRVRMLNIYWYDDHYHDIYPAVLDLP